MLVNLTTEEKDRTTELITTGERWKTLIQVVPYISTGDSDVPREQRQMINRQWVYFRKTDDESIKKYGLPALSLPELDTTEKDYYDGFFHRIFSEFIELDIPDVRDSILVLTFVFETGVAVHYYRPREGEFQTAGKYLEFASQYGEYKNKNPSMDKLREQYNTENLFMFTFVTVSPGYSATLEEHCKKKNTIHIQAPATKTETSCSERGETEYNLYSDVASGDAFADYIATDVIDMAASCGEIEQAWRYFRLTNETSIKQFGKPDWHVEKTDLDLDKVFLRYIGFISHTDNVSLKIMTRNGGLYIRYSGGFVLSDLPPVQQEYAQILYEQCYSDLH